MSKERPEDIEREEKRARKNTEKKKKKSSYYLQKYVHKSKRKQAKDD